MLSHNPRSWGVREVEAGLHSIVNINKRNIFRQSVSLYKTSKQQDPTVKYKDKSTLQLE